MISLTDERHSAARKRAGEARELKGKRSRSFLIHPGLKTILEGITYADDGRVFHNPKGARLKPDRVHRLLIRIILTPLSGRPPTAVGKVRGFADGRIRSFRHYFCSACENFRVPEQTLMNWLGHRNSRMIRRYYYLHDEASQQGVLFSPPSMNLQSKPVTGVGGRTFQQPVIHSTEMLARQHG